ncbi:MAG: hypothetical protein ACP5G0_08390 [Desulfomonilia bacterium]
MAEKAVMRVSSELSERKRIEALLEKRRGIKKEKLIRYLASRGFPYDTILDTMDGVST